MFLSTFISEEPRMNLLIKSHDPSFSSPCLKVEVLMAFLVTGFFSPIYAGCKMAWLHWFLLLFCICLVQRFFIACLSLRV